MLVVSLSFFTLHHRLEDFILAFTSLPLVPFVITGRVCLMSVANKTVLSAMSRLLVPKISKCHVMNREGTLMAHCRFIPDDHFAIADGFALNQDILQVVLSLLDRLNGSFKHK